MASVAACKERQRALTQHIIASPYDPLCHIERARFYADIGLPELAVGDVYKAVLLLDDAEDDSSEYFDRVYAAIRRGQPERSTELMESYVLARSIEAVVLLIEGLLTCGCPRAAYPYCIDRCRRFPDDETFQKLRRKIRTTSSGSLLRELDASQIAQLPSRSLIHARLFPWNDHEPDRFSEDSLQQLNKAIQAVAPKLRAQATELPVLAPGSAARPMRNPTSKREESLKIKDAHNGVGSPHEPVSLPSAMDELLTTASSSSPKTTRQLGLFAAEDIEAGELVLSEHSLLSASLGDESSCDACAGSLPPQTNISTSSSTDDDEEGPLICPYCDEALFCSMRCKVAALGSYHKVTCGEDVERFGRQRPPVEAPDALYLLLLTRAIALAEARKAHLLDLDELKFLWGDFAPDPLPSSKLVGPTGGKLPFSFEYNVLYPIHVLEQFNVDIYALTERYDFWVLNTLYAKMRAVANGRVDPRTGRPVASAVHPLWCLANHGCAPNVWWVWDGDINMSARTGEELVRWGGKDLQQKGIRKGEEIVNHYCDVDLDVRARREWMMGPLGGVCMCQRCVWEEARDRDRQGVTELEAKVASISIAEDGRTDEGASHDTL